MDLEQVKEKCIKARLVAQKEDGAYVTYVFENTSSNIDPNDMFIMCTRCPNWRGQEPKDLQEGFLSYKYVEGGKDTYYDQHEQTFKQYNYTAMYFLDFVPITHILRDGYVVGKYDLKVK